MKVMIKTLFLLLNNCFAFNKMFFRYTTPQIINHFKPFITYTASKIRNNTYGSIERTHWEKTNRNIHSAIKYAKLRNDKCLYLGWSPESLTIVENNYDNTDAPFMYIFLDIESVNILQITHIVQNPYVNVKIDFSLFKKNLIEFTDNIGIYLDISQLKQYDDGRWYLDFIHTRS